MVEVKIKCAHTVKPSEATWTGTLPLSEWDQAAGAAYVPYIYFFKPGPDTAQPKDQEIVGVLKESLSRCLVHFYPMAGRIHRMEGGRLELRCNAEGAVLVEAETSGEVAEMGDFLDSKKFKDLIYAVDYSKPTHELALLYAQVTVFACGGFSLGITMSHAVTDGLGGLHVTSEWARLTRGEGLERTPYLTREVLRAGEPPREPAARAKHSEQPEEKGAQAPPPPPPMKETTMVNLVLTKKQVEKLKMAANAANDGTSRPYSRYEVLTTHIWRCACKARRHVGEELNGLGFGMDSRIRIQPPLPPNFWGNAVLMVVAKSKGNVLVSKPLGYGCSRVRSTIEKVTNDYIWSDIENLKNLDDLSVWRGLPDPEGGSYVFPNVMVISWLTLPVYGMDFGWGKEVHMGPATHTHDGTAMILPGRAEQGSVVVAICLQVAHVDSFKQHFYQDIAVEN